MRIRTAGVLLISAGLIGLPAHADLYSASAAVEKQDLARAFELYREVAELGRVDAQQILAVSYVNGEGVQRDNVLGLGWALIAKENGGGAVVQPIIDQLEPHLTDAARQRIVELHGRFGKEALQKTLLPVVRTGPISNDTGCTFATPANPDDYYPRDAIQRGISGSVYLEYTITADGRAHHSRVLYGWPAGVFDEAGRAAIRHSTFKAKRENGVAVPCSMRVRIKFGMRPPGASSAEQDFDEQIKTVQPKARAGDPASELLYGLILVARPDLNRAKEDETLWFLKAAQAGIPAAQYLLATNIRRGGRVEAEAIKAAAWLTYAAKGGNAPAQVALANYLLESGAAADADAACDWLERALTTGSTDAHYHLAALLATTPNAARRDPQRAIRMTNEMLPALKSDPTVFEIRAAAKAAAGDFEGAREDQKRAVSIAKRLGWDAASQQARLGSYEQGKLWTGNLFAL